MLLKSSLGEGKDLFILESQYHGCWWSGNTRSQGISSHGILPYTTRKILVSPQAGLILQSQLGQIYISVQNSIKKDVSPAALNLKS